MIAVHDVTKRYGPTLAVDRVSFRIGAGEIVGFLGPNGAGKSTLLKILSTWLRPTSGRAEVAGFDVERHPLEVRRRLGYLPEHSALWEGMRVDRLLRFIGSMRGLTGRRLDDRFAWVVSGLSLETVLRKRLNECSKGFRQRIGVASALIHDPAVIVLDEPTHGLDPRQVVAFRNFLRSLREARTILFSSHILSEVASISDRLLIINRGRLLADAPLAEMRDRAARKGTDLEGIFLEMVGGAGMERDAEGAGDAVRAAGGPA